MEMDAILGAGIGGLFCGHELFKNKRKFMIIEKQNSVGGIAKTLNFGGFRTDLGPHRFYSKNEELYLEIEKILGKDWIIVKRYTPQYINGKWYDYPIKINQALKNAGLIKGFKIGSSFLFQQAKNCLNKKEPSNFEEWIVSKFGRELAEFSMLNYTEKIWGIKCRDISVEWAKQRIKGLSIPEIIKNALINPREKVATFIDEFYYPRYGIGMISGKIAEIIKKNGNKIILNSKVNEIKHNEKKIESVKIKNKKTKVNNIVSSIPIGELVNLLNPRAPKKVLDALKNLRYRDQVYVFLTINKERVTNSNWIYFPEKNIPFGRIMEPKNWTKEMSPENKTSLLAEYFANKGDKTWEMGDEKIKEITVRVLEKLNFLKKEEVIDYKIIRLEKAYPQWDINYEENLKIVMDFLSKFENLYLIGRNGRFRYNNMDHSMLTGIMAARSIIENKKYDLESVGMEQEYFETGVIKK